MNEIPIQIPSFEFDFLQLAKHDKKLWTTIGNKSKSIISLSILLSRTDFLNLNE
jgi:hypothetical protein